MLYSETCMSQTENAIKKPCFLISCLLMPSISCVAWECVLLFFFLSHTSVLVWFCPCTLGLLWPSTSLPAVTLSMSSESMLDADAHAEFTLDLWEGASCSLTAPTEPVLRCCPLLVDPDEGRRWAVAEEEDEEEVVEEEEEMEVCRAASSMLIEAFSSWDVMSAREMLEAVGRVWPLVLVPRTVLAGDARVLLLVLPVQMNEVNYCSRIYI